MAEDKQPQGQILWMVVAIAVVLIAVFPLLSNVFFGQTPQETPAPTRRPAKTPDAAPTQPPAPLVSEGGIPVRSSQGEQYFPDEKNWVYHFAYAYPLLEGDSLAVAKINDTYRDVLNEMVQLTLPMFANAEDMRFDGKNEVRHDFTVTRNDGVLLSILQTRSQSKGAEGTQYSLEPNTFGETGFYAGEALTLRGAALLLAGVDPALDLESLSPEEYPDWAALIAGSSSRLSDALLPELYQAFTALQQAGVALPGLDADDFEGECYPARDFYVNEEGQIVFFFSPMLLTEPSFDVPAFAYTPAQLNAVLLAAGPEEE